MNVVQLERALAGCSARSLPCSFCGAKPGDACHRFSWDTKRAREVEIFLPEVHVARETAAAERRQELTRAIAWERACQAEATTR